VNIGTPGLVYSYRTFELYLVGQVLVHYVCCCQSLEYRGVLGYSTWTNRPSAYKLYLPYWIDVRYFIGWN